MLVDMAEVPGNNFRILGIPLQRADTLAGISLLTPAVGQPVDVSDLFRVNLAALVSRIWDGPWMKRQGFGNHGFTISKRMCICTLSHCE
jgi:hypothetical protein